MIEREPPPAAAEQRKVDPALARSVLESSLGLKSGERLVVVTDTLTQEIGEALFQGGVQAGATAVMVVITPTGRSGAEPPEAAAAAMVHADVLVCPTKFSLSHTQARHKATQAGARVATMPGIHAGMFFDGPITADFAQVERRTLELERLLTQASEARIVSGGGKSELRFSIRGRSGLASTGRCLEPGSWGNLPSGEAYLAPVEGTAEGVLVVNASVAGIGRLQQPLRLCIRKGQLVEADGESGTKLLAILGDAAAGRNVAEFGIGTNEKARITGVVLEDEKAMGTIHIAFGDNSTFGGTVRAGVHIDVVVQGADVYLDDHQILDAGRLLV
jgi:leucyl aminopeptidase (aminopeptidase T)